MSKRSSRSSAKTKSVEAPIDADLKRRALKIVRTYRLIIKPSERLGYVGSTLEAPTVFADARTPEACVKETIQAQAGYVAMLLEAGDAPPTPVSEARRDAQINIRVTTEEKMVLEDGARRAGYRNVSEFIRTCVLAQLASRSSGTRSGRRAG